MDETIEVARRRGRAADAAAAVGAAVATVGVVVAPMDDAVVPLVETETDPLAILCPG